MDVFPGKWLKKSTLTNHGGGTHHRKMIVNAD